MNEDMQKMALELRNILRDMTDVSVPEPGDVMVVGCSTSEVMGQRIGQGSSPDVAMALYPELRAFAVQHDLELAFQCCEHLNRALVVERHLARKHGWVIVQAVPHRRAGGSMATGAYHAMEDPCLVEAIQGGYGIDIGETMIGMHMRPVAVPMRLPHNRVGEARVSAAFSRPKLIGGARARYDGAVDENEHE